MCELYNKEHYEYVLVENGIHIHVIWKYHTLMRICT